MAPIVSLIFTIACIYFVFTLVRPLDLNRFMPSQPGAAAALKVVLALALGFLLAEALLTMLDWARAMPGGLLKD
ncbi:DUF1146 domain-containing protein [Leuconostocaceae bacterium ESL0958]|nr:DUF1146 domain-containing protein [Leuconostocaceae bacterium ESL0958]